jgi:acyl dehydratase
LSQIILRGLTGHGNKGVIKVKYPPVPKRAPDFVVEEKSNSSQALLYRLNGDLNPLHVNADMAALGGFKKPISHGLLTYGFTARALYQAVCSGNVNLIKKFSGQFTSHAFPGETYIVEIWKDGNNLVF